MILCGVFLKHTECSLAFEQQPSQFQREVKVAYMISLLTGRAFAWATSLWEQNSPDIASGKSFAKAMRVTFHNPHLPSPKEPVRLWTPPGPDPSLEPIISAPRILAPLRWELETAIRETLRQKHFPGGSLPCKLCMPAAVRQWVLLWGHASHFQVTQGWLEPWTFCAGLAWREICMPLLRLARHVHSARHPSHGPSVSFPLPSAKETAELLLQHVVRVHGMPSDLVSDQSPQFTSHFWKAFCSLMGDLAMTLWYSANPSSWVEYLP
ncbi:hypothetical protein AOLI_G00107760 [Acnodon oligacanthus]